LYVQKSVKIAEISEIASHLMPLGDRNVFMGSSAKDSIFTRMAQSTTVRERLAFLRKTLERGIDAESLEAFYSLLAAIEPADECMHVVPAKDEDTDSQDSTITAGSTKDKKDSLMPARVPDSRLTQWLDSSSCSPVMVDATTQVQEAFDDIDYFTEVKIENDIELENYALASACQDNFSSPNCSEERRIPTQTSVPAPQTPAPHTPEAKNEVIRASQRRYSPTHDNEVAWKSMQSCTTSGAILRQGMREKGRITAPSPSRGFWKGKTRLCVCLFWF